MHKLHPYSRRGPAGGEASAARVTPGVIMDSLWLSLLCEALPTHPTCFGCKAQKKTSFAYLLASRAHYT